MPFLDVIGLLALGALLGFLGGLLGIGGGLFAIPLLAVILNLNEQHAQGTSLVMVVPNVMIGLWNYTRRENLDLRFSLTLAASALPLTFIGAHAAATGICNLHAVRRGRNALPRLRAGTYGGSRAGAAVAICLARRCVRRLSLRYV